MVIITHKKCPYCAEGILIDAKICNNRPHNEIFIIMWSIFTYLIYLDTFLLCSEYVLENICSLVHTII